MRLKHSFNITRAVFRGVENRRLLPRVANFKRMDIFSDINYYIVFVEFCVKHITLFDYNNCFLKHIRFISG